MDAADFSGDEYPDLVISYHKTKVVSYRNRQGEGFRPIPMPAVEDPHACVIGDVDDNDLGDVYCTVGAGRGTLEKSNALWLQVSPDIFSSNVAEAWGVDDPFGRGRRTTFLDIENDGHPDLFVGNRSPRQNARPTPNRTFRNDAGTHFDEVRLGLTREWGAFCVQAVDYNRDGWEDLLLCGQRRLVLFKNVAGPDGGRRFANVTKQTGVGKPDVRSAWMADFDRDGRLDVALVQQSRFRVILRPGAPSPRVLVNRPLRQGEWVAVGNVDGAGPLDVYVVQGCRRDGNLRDYLLLGRRRPMRFETVPSPQASRGCGDVATTLDVDGDGADEVVVLNGRPLGTLGPVQVLTMSPGLPA